MTALSRIAFSTMPSPSPEVTDHVASAIERDLVQFRDSYNEWISTTSTDAKTADNTVIEIEARFGHNPRGATTSATQNNNTSVVRNGVSHRTFWNTKALCESYFGSRATMTMQCDQVISVSETGREYRRSFSNTTALENDQSQMNWVMDKERKQSWFHLSAYGIVMSMARERHVELDAADIRDAEILVERQKERYTIVLDEASGIVADFTVVRQKGVDGLEHEQFEIEIDWSMGVRKFVTLTNMMSVRSFVLTVMNFYALFMLESPCLYTNEERRRMIRSINQFGQAAAVIVPTSASSSVVVAPPQQQRPISDNTINNNMLTQARQATIEDMKTVISNLAIGTKDYTVAAKADGIRRVLCFVEAGIVMVLPPATVSLICNESQPSLEGLLIDCEYFPNTRELWIIDVIAFPPTHVTHHLSQVKRRALLEQLLLSSTLPKQQQQQQKWIIPSVLNANRVTLQFKEALLARTPEELVHVLKTVTTNVKFPADGIMVTQNHGSPYLSPVLKLKPVDKLSVDFAVRSNSNSDGLIHLMSSSGMRKYDLIKTIQLALNGRPYKINVVQSRSQFLSSKIEQPIEVRITRHEEEVIVEVVAVDIPYNHQRRESPTTSTTAVAAAAAMTFLKPDDVEDFIYNARPSQFISGIVLAAYDRENHMLVLSIQSRDNVEFLGSKEHPWKPAVGNVSFQTLSADDQTRLMKETVVEFVFRDGVWLAERIRRDKPYPNSIDVALSMWHAIHYPVLVEDFIREAEMSYATTTTTIAAVTATTTAVEMFGNNNDRRATRVPLVTRRLYGERLPDESNLDQWISGQAVVLAVAKIMNILAAVVHQKQYHQENPIQEMWLVWHRGSFDASSSMTDVIRATAAHFRTNIMVLRAEDTGSIPTVRTILYETANSSYPSTVFIALSSSRYFSAMEVSTDGKKFEMSVECGLY